jgi:hypothetical protein
VETLTKTYKDSIFFYAKQDRTIIDGGGKFCIGIQTPEMKASLLEWGHDRGVFMDATHGSNKDKVCM